MCSRPVFTVSEDRSVDEAIELMKEHGIRRLAVVDEEGELSGIMTTDDIGYKLRMFSKGLALEYFTIIQRIKRIQ